MDQLTGGEGGEEKDEGRVGFEAIIAPNTTGSLGPQNVDMGVITRIRPTILSRLIIRAVIIRAIIISA